MADSKHSQNPESLRVIDGITYVVSSGGKPRFNFDGSPLKEGGVPQCKSKCKGNGYRCIRFVCVAFPVCNVHGAGSPRQGRPGGRPPTTGKFTRDLPRDLQVRLLKAHNDPNLLSLTEQIALVQARTTKLLSQLPREDEMAISLQSLIKGAKMYKSGLEQRDERKEKRGLDLITISVDTVDADIQQWDSIVTIIDKQSRLMEREMKIRKEMRAVLSVDEAMAMVLLMKNVVNENVKDQTTRNRIAHELRSYFQLTAATPNQTKTPVIVEGALA